MVPSSNLSQRTKCQIENEGSKSWGSIKWLRWLSKSFLRRFLALWLCCLIQATYAQPKVRCQIGSKGFSISASLFERIMHTHYHTNPVNCKQKIQMNCSKPLSEKASRRIVILIWKFINIHISTKCSGTNGRHLVWPEAEIIWVIAAAAELTSCKSQCTHQE